MRSNASEFAGADMFLPFAAQAFAICIACYATEPLATAGEPNLLDQPRLAADHARIRAPPAAVRPGLCLLPRAQSTRRSRRTIAERLGGSRTRGAAQHGRTAVAHGAGRHHRARSASGRQTGKPDLTHALG